MSTQTANPPPKASQSTSLIKSPPLNSGDRLSRAEFERHYAAHPEIKIEHLERKP